MGISMTNIATPMPQLRAKFTSKLGIPLSGCKVYTYEPGSDTPKTTWIDIDKTTENTNPILLDAAGEADIYLDGLYRIVVKDRFGFVIYDVEKTGLEGNEAQQEINKRTVLSAYDYYGLGALDVTDEQAVLVKKPGISGEFVYSSSSPKTPNGGTVIEDSQGRIWERVDTSNPLVSWWGAAGDGINNDSLAFASLEMVFTQTAVNLLGKTYKVSGQPDANKYYNGKFLIGSNLIDLALVNKQDIDSELLKLKNTNTISIEHVREGGFIYDVISNIQPSQLQAISNRSNPASPLMTRLTAKEAAKKYNKSVLVNCSAFKNASGAAGWGEATLLPNGIYIEDGVVVADWSYANAIAKNQACCLMNTGELKRFYREETTAEQMVEQGAVFGVSWGAWLVYGGVVPPDFATSTINDSTKSAKTIICQMPDNSISFILIEGVSGSYGATSAEAGQLALSIGAKSAFNLDGGGSTQCWWGNTYAVPSSDETTRTLPCYLAINTPAVNEYDSGVVKIAHNPAFGDTVVDSTKPPLYVRQLGDSVTLQLNINSAITTEIQPLTDGTALPARYNASSSSITRGICLGGSGRLFKLYQGGYPSLGLFTVESVDQALKPTTVLGSLKWFTKHI